VGCNSQELDIGASLDSLLRYVSSFQVKSLRFSVRFQIFIDVSSAVLSQKQAIEAESY
jgi:hypothetical protein